MLGSNHGLNVLVLDCRIILRAIKHCSFCGLDTGPRVEAKFGLPMFFWGIPPPNRAIPHELFHVDMRNFKSYKHLDLVLFLPANLRTFMFFGSATVQILETLRSCSGLCRQRYSTAKGPQSLQICAFH